MGTNSGPRPFVLRVRPPSGTSAAAARHFLLVIQLVQDVRESLGVHQAVFDGDVQQLLRHFGQPLVDHLARTLVGSVHLGETGPVGGLVLRQLAGRRIDAEGEQAIKFLVERAAGPAVARDQIPIEGVDVAQGKR